LSREIITALIQAHHYMKRKHGAWLLCSISVIPENKLSLQELNLLIGIKLLTLSFLETFGS